jgi:hypothetical protein
MRLRVIREPTQQGATLGALYVDDVWTCWTLEDPIRETAEPVEAWKIAGDTAIPEGIYDVVVTWSSRFDRLLPLIRNVPGFTGIRIHTGNTAVDTSGCLLVGLARAGAQVLKSRVAFDALWPRLTAVDAAHDLITIAVENPPGYTHG